MPDQPVHAEICIHFTLGGEKFEAVGYLQAKEKSVQGAEAIRRVDNGHLIRIGADWRFVYDHRSELPPELQAYWLVTARPRPRYPRDVSSLDRGDVGWCDYWYGLDYQWGRGGLVLRRRV